MSNDKNSQFYAELPILQSFFEVSNPANYHPMPDDWYVGVTDIVNSTIAIQNNQYKTVNILGVSPIVGLLNQTNHQALPYSFGGDGSYICIPSSMIDEAKTVFSASQKIGTEAYDLELRAALIPVSFIREKGYEIKVARFRVSDFYSQAAFTGGGLNYADDFLKYNEGSSFHVSPAENYDEADFSGLECRWKEVSPPGKKVISLLLKCNPENSEPEAVYNKILQKMRDIFDFDDETNPILSSQLQMNTSITKLMGETQFRTSGLGWWGKLKYVLEMEFRILIGKVLMYFNYKTSVTDWSLYKSDLSTNTDHRKFDDMLRVVISGTSGQCDLFEEYLESLFQDSTIAYGIHRTESAVITCMVFAFHRQHVHFVDGSDGGYVEASKGLKRRLKELNKGHSEIQNNPK